jgi:hypothetical protein
MAACERAFYPETKERKVATPQCWHSAFTGRVYNKAFFFNFKRLKQTSWQSPLLLCLPPSVNMAGPPRIRYMAFRPHPARPPAVLLREARPLKALLSQALRLGQLKKLLDTQLQPAAREHCHVASWREGCLLLVVTDGHWATRLRYQQRRLQQGLQDMPEFNGLTRILFKVQPTAGPRRLTGPALDLSDLAADNLQATAEGISDPGLRAALERLAKHRRK